MAVTDQLAKPTESQHQMGRFSLNRIVRQDATIAKPVVWSNVKGIVAVNIGAPTWKYEYDIHQQGAGNELTHVQQVPRWDGTVTILSGQIGTFLAAIDGKTWGTAQAVMSARIDNDNPMVHWEVVCRTFDNVTHLFSLVIQDMVIDSFGFDNPMDYADRGIPFHTYHEPFILAQGREMVFDRFAATPSTSTYTLSCSTPATLVTATEHDDWDYNNAVFIKNEDYSESDVTGRRIRSGATITGASLVFTGSSVPAASDEISVLYAKAT